MRRCSFSSCSTPPPPPPPPLPASRFASIKVSCMRVRWCWRFDFDWWGGANGRSTERPGWPLALKLHAHVLRFPWCCSAATPFDTRDCKCRHYSKSPAKLKTTRGGEECAGDAPPPTPPPLSPAACATYHKCRHPNKSSIRSATRETTGFLRRDSRNGTETPPPPPCLL